MRVEGPPERRQWSGEAGARRLLATVRQTCPAGEDLPTRLEAGLGAALGLLARDPELARSLALRPCLGVAEEEAALEAQQRWIGRFGDLLREAAAADPRASREPAFLAPFLIGGLRFQIARLLLDGEASDLLRLLPGTLETLLAYYFEPGVLRRPAASPSTSRSEGRLCDPGVTEARQVPTSFSPSPFT
jgi:hypothetical protein